MAEPEVLQVEADYRCPIPSAIFSGSAPNASRASSSRRHRFTSSNDALNSSAICQRQNETRWLEPSNSPRSRYLPFIGECVYTSSREKKRKMNNNNVSVIHCYWHRAKFAFYFIFSWFSHYSFYIHLYSS